MKNLCYTDRTSKHTWYNFSREARTGCICFLRGDIHYGEYHRRKHTKISGTDGTAAFTDRLRGDCTGAETAIGNTLSAQYQVSRQTVRKALAILQNEGYIYAEHGRGTFCSEMMRHAHPSKNIAVVTTYLSDYIFPV